MLESDFQKLDVTGLITLYELDATAVGAGIIRWHGHILAEDWVRIYAWAGREDKNAGNTEENAGREYWLSDTEKTINRDIVWQGDIFAPISIKTEGLEMRGDGKASSPSLSVANKLGGVQGAISVLCLQFQDLVGSKLTVVNTLAKYLDAVNFTEGNPQAANEYRKQTWYVEQKTNENGSTVSFELSNPVDFEGARIPTREITSYCHWAVHGRYRGSECGYIGTARFDGQGNVVTDPTKDYCGGRLSDCRLRFGSRRSLPFGGFPSSSLISR